MERVLAAYSKAVVNYAACVNSASCARVLFSLTVIMFAMCLKSMNCGRWSTPLDTFSRASYHMPKKVASLHVNS
jgi:hypothetical protein